MNAEEKRAKWGDGPWVDEPDRVEFYAHGLPCLMRRTEHLGAWCGYVGVAPGHPLHGYDATRFDSDGPDLDAHGGITYAGPGSDDICHKEAAGAHWFGFDCAHGGDYMPMMGAWRKWGRESLDPNVREISEAYEKLMQKFPHPRRFLNDEYRDAAYVRAECEQLAKQLAGMTHGK